MIKAIKLIFQIFDNDGIAIARDVKFPFPLDGEELDKLIGEAILYLHKEEEKSKKVM